MAVSRGGALRIEQCEPVTMRDKDGVIAVVTTASRLADRHDNRVGPAPREVVMKYFAGLDAAVAVVRS